MSDVRCPMCGKNNAAEAETCRFCRARLKPLSATPSSPSEEPDWLLSLRGGGFEDSQPQPKEEDAPSPDWLSGLRESQASSANAEAMAKIESVPEEEWLNAFHAPVDEIDIPHQESLLDQLREVPSGEPRFSSGLGPSDESEQDLNRPVYEPPAAEEENLDWIRQLSAIAPPDQPVSAPRAAKPEPALPSEELPDWLSGMSSLQDGEASSPAAEESLPAAAPTASPFESGAPEFPDWLNSLEGSAAPVSSPVQGETSSSAATAAAASAAASAATFSALPDWLQNIQPGERSEASPASAGEWKTPPPFSGMEDLFADPGSGSSATPPPEETPAALPPPETPDWLKNLNPAAAESTGTPALVDASPVAISSSGSESPFSGDLPDWLSQFNADDQVESENAIAEAAPAFEPEAEVSPEAVHAEEHAEELAEDISPAELPTWVEAMRPVEVFQQAGGATDQRIEASGPLAGIAGVLPVESLAAVYRKPPVYSPRLRMSEKQEALTALLKDLLTKEGQSQEVKTERTKAPQIILRVMMGFALMLVVLFPLLTGFQLAAPPAPPAAQAHFFEQIQKLPANSAVLVAVEYESALSGEMQPAASGVIRHLMGKNARLALLTTQPSGVVLGKKLVERARQGTSFPSDQAIALGYLPGNAASLLEFSLNPRQAVPAGLDGTPVWNQAALKDIHSISDFAAIVVISGEVENGQAWIEQVQPVLRQTGKNIPLLLVTSAQASVMLQPYADSGQVQGLMTGVTGGATYEQLTGQPGEAYSYWGAYQATLVVGILLVGLGGLTTGLFSLSRPKPKKEA